MGEILKSLIKREHKNVHIKTSMIILKSSTAMTNTNILQIIS